MTTIPQSLPAIKRPPIGRAMTRGIEMVGLLTRRGVEAVGRSARFVGDVVLSLANVSTWGPVATQQARRLGVDSLPIGVFIAIFTGIVLALLAKDIFTGAFPRYFVGSLVEKTILMELAPVLTGLALAGRVGANIAAELGTMRVTEQVDALESLGYDPLSYLVVPRVLAGVVMFPIVVAAAMMTGVTAGWLVAIGLVHLSTPDFVKGFRLFFEPFDVEYGLVKSASFGLAVTLVGCLRGLATRGGAEGVGRAATGAVVVSAVLILVLDAFWAVVWLLGR